MGFPFFGPLITAGRAARIAAAPEAGRGEQSRMVQAAADVLTTNILEDMLEDDRSIPREADQLRPHVRTAPAWKASRIIVLADRGAGKTRQLLEWMRVAVEDLEPQSLAKDDVDQTGFPVYIDLSFRGPMPVQSLITAAFADLGWPRQHFDLLPKNNGLLLLVDGIDDVPERDRGEVIAAFTVFLAKHPFVGIVFASSLPARADDLMRAMRVPNQPAFSVVRLPDLRQEEVRAFLTARCRPDLWNELPSLRDKPELWLPLTLNAILRLASTIKSVELEGHLRKLHGPDQARRELMRLLATHQFGSVLPVLRWLARGVRLELGAVSFQPQRIEPRWLEHRQALAFMAIGMISALPLVLFVTGLWFVLRLPASGAWIPATVGTLAVAAVTPLRGLLYQRKRRFPVRVRARRVRMLPAIQAIRYRPWSFIGFVLAVAVAGVPVGLAFDALARFVPSPSPSLRFVAAMIIVGLALIVIGWIPGQLLAGLSVGWGSSLASDLLWQNVLAGVTVGGIGAAVFRFCDYGEETMLDQSQNLYWPGFWANVRAQIVFETLKWSVFAWTYAYVMYKITGGAEWFKAGAAGTAIGLVAFGLLGSWYPAVSTWLTIRFAERQFGVNFGLPEVLDQLKSKGLLLNTPNGNGLRFLHPALVDFLVEPG